jgi:hypothetical protein
MQPAMLAAEVFSSVAARVDPSADVSLWQRSMLATARAAFSAARAGHGGPGAVDRWLLTLASLIVLLAVGRAAAKVLRQLTRKSTPELIVLLNQSAAFYSRWPEDQHVNAPHAELLAEASRCRRIVELLERRAATELDSGPASRGPIDGLHAWIAVLQRQIHLRDDAPSGTAYA